MTDLTPNLALPYLAPAQAQKHVTVNETVRALDALVLLAVESRQVGAPPDELGEGERYVVADGATGAWSGRDHAVAAFQDGAWSFFAPRTGWLAHVADEDVLVVYRDGAWSPAPLSAETLDSVPRLGVNAAADTINRFAVGSQASLFNHDGAGHRLKINKAAATDTASVLFQNGFSGRAEFGLAGSDTFSVKVSPDGAAWREALSIDPVRGVLSAASGLKLGGNLSIAGEDWLGNTITVASDVATGQFRGERARGALADPQPLKAGDMVCAFAPLGHDGTAYRLLGGFRFHAETDLDAELSSYFLLAVMDRGTWNEALRVRADGNLGVGVAAPRARVDADGPIRPGAYVRADLPDPAGLAGALIYVSDAPGGGVPAFSVGGDWLRLDDRSVVG